MCRMNFLNTSIDNLTMEEALLKIDQMISERSCRYVVTPNMDHIVMLEEDEEFSNVYDAAHLILADGMPLIWISKWLKRPIKEKVSGSDLFPQMCQLAAERGYKVFLLGAGDGVAAKAADNLKTRYQGLQIVGTYAPKYGFENDTNELAYIKEKILESQPDLLAVALGSPKGEKFIYTHLQEYQVPLSISIGATLDYEAGILRRAPQWMSALGFEWLFRITQDPKRLAKRYWRDAISIVPIIKKYKYQRNEDTL